MRRHMAEMSAKGRNGGESRHLDKTYSVDGCGLTKHIKAKK